MAVYQDLSGRGPSLRALFVRGVAVIAALALISSFLYRSGTSQYDKPFVLTVVTDSIGEGLLAGAEVKYRGYPIGSVRTLEPLGAGKQQMTLLLDGSQAGVLAQDTKAKFRPSNNFGTTAVELFSSGEGPRLVSGATLRVEQDKDATSLTGLLRSSGKIQRAFDQAFFDQAMTVFRRHADAVGPVSQALFDTARIVTILGQHEKVSQSLSAISSVLNGVSNALPVVAQTSRVTHSFSWILAPGVADNVDVNFFRPLDGLLVEGNDVIDRNQDWLVPLIRGIMNIVSPLSYSLGSIAPEYSRLPSLLDKTGQLFYLAHGGKPLALHFVVDTVPGLGNALADARPDAPPASRAGSEPRPAEQSPDAEADDPDLEADPDDSGSEHE